MIDVEVDDSPEGFRYRLHYACKGAVQTSLWFAHDDIGWLKYRDERGRQKWAFTVSDYYLPGQEFKIISALTVAKIVSGAIG